MNHHGLELDRGVRDAKLNDLKPRFRSAYYDCVMIPLAVYPLLSEEDPGTGTRIGFLSAERHPRSRARPPVRITVDEIDAADYPVVTAQVNGPCLAAGGNVVA